MATKIDYAKARFEENINNEWLGLGDTSKIKTSNPLIATTKEDLENPGQHLIKIMKQQENFYFTCEQLFGKTLHPFQLAILRELWIRPYPMLIATRGAGKTFLLGLYALLRAILVQGVKVVIVGSAFRQSQAVFNYALEVWHSSPMLRDICGDTPGNGPKCSPDKWIFRVGESTIVALPIGDGSKIRGERANVIIADEFASMSIHIFETVIEAFAAVNMEPVEKVKERGRLRAMAKLGLAQAKPQYLVGLNGNQTIISGSAYYGFNHFAAYWHKWKSIVESEGDREKLALALGGEPGPNFNWKDYSVIRLPVELLPDGFMDEKHVAKAKATLHASSYGMEYSATFMTDSNGFFKRSIIEKCVCGNTIKPIFQESCGEVSFTASLRGHQQGRYVIAVDPASERDNFCIIILEIWPDHRRIVHCWTTTKARFKAKLAKQLIEEDDFYVYCASKIRQLKVLFPCERIVMDSQGGGVAVGEALQAKKNIPEGQRPIVPIVDPEKPQPSDDLVGEHILELVNFASATWVSAANHGLRHDLETRTLIFPEFDAAVVGMAGEEDIVVGRVEGDTKLHDTLEDAVMEIEELKDELATIVHTQTGITLRDRWDTPEVKLQGGKKGRLRKDRYSALLMANMTSRTMANIPLMPEYVCYGGFSKDLIKNRGAIKRTQHQNPDWYRETVGVGVRASR